MEDFNKTFFEARKITLSSTLLNSYQCELCISNLKYRESLKYYFNIIHIPDETREFQHFPLKYKYFITDKFLI